MAFPIAERVQVDFHLVYRRQEYWTSLSEKERERERERVLSEQFKFSRSLINLI